MEQQELIKKPSNGTALVVSTPTPMELLQMAVQKGVDLDQLTKLMDLQERWEAREAKRQFDEAMGEFKKHPPVIVKNKHVEFGNTKYDHATLDEVTDKVAEALSKVGIRHSFEPSQTGTDISITCVLSGFGHEERRTLKAGPDTSGSKNAIQAIASTTTYLQRYTLLMAVGMAPEGEDDDGQSAGLGSDWLSEHCEWLMNSRNSEELQKLFTAYFKEARSSNDKRAMDFLIKAKDERKREILS